MRMKTQIPHVINGTSVLQLIEDAKDAELCRNIDLSRSILSSIWGDIDLDPDLDQFEPIVQAQILRLCGFFLSFFGRSRGVRDYQLRGKNLLTKAIGIFSEFDVPDRAAEANVMLALCYWYSGEVEECELILETVENEFSGNELHPVYLQIRVNRLMIHYWKGEDQLGLSILHGLKVPMEFCTDLRLVAMYHIQAGIIHRSAGLYDQGIFHLKEAIRAARKINNLRFVGWSLNNLAFLYKEIKEFGLAHGAINESLSLLGRLGDFGWIPHVLDTQALIHFAQREYSDALSIVEKAIDGFRPTEDYSGLADSLWTKCRCLLRLGQADDAFIVYGEVQAIAAQKIGETATIKFAKSLAGEVYCVKDLSLTEEVAAFKKARVCSAIAQTGSISIAAKQLGKTHQALSEILNNQFPEIYDELGLQRRKRRADAIAPKKLVRDLPDVALLPLPKTYQVLVDGSDETNSVETYYCSANVMGAFNIHKNSLVAVFSPDKNDLSAGLTLLYMFEDRYYFGKLELDLRFRLFFLNCPDFRGPLTVDEVELVGIVIGYCEVDALNRDPRIEFRELHLISNE